jgi:hypothetical protein
MPILGNYYYVLILVQTLMKSSSFSGGLLITPPIITCGMTRSIIVTFKPPYTGIFEATLNFHFTIGQMEVVVERSVKAIVGPNVDISSVQVNSARQRKGGWSNYVPPKQTENLRLRPGTWSLPGWRSKTPAYPLPEIIQEALEKRKFHKHAEEILRSMLPQTLNLKTYCEYFSALIRVEEGAIAYVIYLSTFRSLLTSFKAMNCRKRTHGMLLCRAT